MPNVPGIVVSFPNPENIMQFAVEIAPKDGLYSGAKFMFTVNVPATYPYDPPKVQCDTLVRIATGGRGLSDLSTGLPPEHRLGRSRLSQYVSTFLTVAITVSLTFPDILRADWMPVLSLGAVVFGTSAFSTSAYGSILSN